MDKNIIEINNLKVSIKQGRKNKKEIVKGISFNLKENQILGLIGESGAGKSMTVYAISSLLPPKGTIIEGEIKFFDGVDILKLSQKEKRKYLSEHLAVVLQDSMNSLNPYESIERQVIETVKFKDKSITNEEALKKGKELLRKVGFNPDEHDLTKLPYEYSGGMRQRIAIALSLAYEPKLIIADEPTTALDAIHQRTFIKFIKKLCKDNNISLIYISHNLALVSELCDYIVVLDHGEIVDMGEKEEVFKNPKSEKTKELIYYTKDLMRTGVCKHAKNSRS